MGPALENEVLSAGQGLDRRVESCDRVEVLASGVVVV